MPSFSFVASATVNGTTPTIPATAQAGDFCVALDYAHDADGTAPVLVTPSGWTNVADNAISQGSDSPRAAIWYRILAGGDANPVFMAGAGGGGSRTRKILIVFRPDATIATVVPSTPTGQATTGDPASQTIAMSGKTVPVIGVAHYCAQNNPATRTWTGGSPTEINNSAQFGKYLVYNSSPADATIDMPDNGVNVLQGIYFEFTFAAAGGLVRPRLHQPRFKHLLAR